MDIDWCYYLATKVLNMSEEEFKKSTPSKLFRLLEIHQEVNNPKEDKKKKSSNSEEKYIDQINF